MKNLIINNSKARVYAFNEFLIIKQYNSQQVIAYKHLKAVYINKNIPIPIAKCYLIAQKIPLYLIDNNGYILATLIKDNNEN